MMIVRKRKSKIGSIFKRGQLFYLLPEWKWLLNFSWYHILQIDQRDKILLWHQNEINRLDPDKTRLPALVHKRQMEATRRREAYLEEGGDPNDGRYPDVKDPNFHHLW